MHAAAEPATATLEANATSICATGMPIRASAMACAGKAAARQIQMRSRGTISSAPSSTMLGGQNGAKMLSERVPIKNAISAPSQYATKTKKAVCVASQNSATAGARTENAGQLTRPPVPPRVSEASLVAFLFRSPPSTTPEPTCGLSVEQLRGDCQQP